MNEQEYGFTRVKVADNLHPIIKTVHDAINDSGLTLKEISVLSGVDVGTMRRWVNGTRSPKLTQVDDVLQACGYELDVMGL